MQSILESFSHPIEHSVLKEKKDIFDTLFSWMFGGLFFILPIFFLPFTADFFDLNKTYLTIGFAVVATFLYFLMSFVRGELAIRAPKAYLGIAVLLGMVSLSVVFSTNKFISLFGFHGNYSTSFLLFVAFALVLFVASNVSLNVTRIVRMLSAGVGIATLLALCSYFGLAIPYIGSAVREFSLVGSANMLFGLQLLAFFSCLYVLPDDLARHDLKRAGFDVAVILLTAGYMIVGLSLVVAVLFVLGIAYLVLTRRLVPQKNIAWYGGMLGVLALFSVMVYLPATRSAFGIHKYNQTLRLGAQESWVIAASTVRDYPFLGTGYGTQYLNFSRYRPASLNTLPSWQVRYSVPYNDLFLMLATVGLLGFAAYVFFWGRALKDALAFSRAKSQGKYVGMLVTMGVGAVVFLGYNPLLLTILFVLIGVVFHQMYPKHSIGAQALSAVGLAFAIALFVGFGYRVYGVYRGQYFFAKASRQTNAITRYNLQKRALTADPRESFYRRETVATGLFIANQLAQKKDLTDTDKQVIQQAVQEAVRDVVRLTQIVNPSEVSNWELRGNVYNFLNGVDKNASGLALQSYTRAISLEPTNPRLWLNVGAIYYRLKAYQNAIQAFARAVDLKSDYANAHYNLAYALKDAGDITNAVTQMEIVQRLLPQDSADKERIQKELDEFKKIAEQRKVEAQKALQLEQQQNPKDVKPVKQEEALTKPADTNEAPANVQIPEGALNPQAKDLQKKPAEPEIPTATGAKVDTTQGQKEAPLAQPAQ